MEGKRSTSRGLLSRVVLAAIALTLVSADAVGGTFPGSNGRLVFDRSSRLYTVNPDGSGEMPITSEDGGASAPSLSADGNRVVFAYRGANGYGIWVVNANGTQARQVTTEPEAVAGSDTDPTWSPGGDRIAFVRGGDLMVMNTDGSGTTNLTATFASGVRQPSWSPAGDRIAFATTFGIFTIGANGSTPQQLPTGNSQQAHNPSWSPDGTRIAYGSVSQVRAINADGTGDVQLAGTLREVWDVAWAPDGTKIAFINDPAGPADAIQERLYMMNADGTGVAPVGTDTGISLDWGVPSTLQLTLEDLPDPIPGVVMNVAPARGVVKIGVPPSSTGVRGSARASQKGLTFVPLTEAEQVPVGSFLDTRKGTVRLQTAQNRAGKRQTGKFLQGLFQVRQSRKRSAKGLTDLVLKGSSFARCGRRGKKASASLSRRRIRRLRANAQGRFRTSGSNSSATVRGTIWDITDRCDGTLTHVKRGKVVVRDFRRKKNITLTSGKSYLAKAPR